LQESIKATQSVPIGTVTWTGQNGSAGKDPPPTRASASNILGRLKNKNGDGGRKICSEFDGRSRLPNGATSPTTTTDTLLRQMCELFRKKGDTLTTQNIKDWCRQRDIDQRNPARAREMRETLKKLATLNKETHIWTLRSPNK
jgi:hypothetical protein